MTALKHPSPIRIADYLAGEQEAEVKHECLGGVIHAMAGGNSRHSAISSNALGARIARLRGKSCQPFSSDMKVRIELSDHTRFYYPDAMAVCSRGPDTALYQDHPVLVVEVLSDFTRRTDLTEKRDAYLAVGTLKQLILGEPDEARVIVYRRKATGGFEAEEDTGIESLILLPEIEAELPLSERVTF